MTSRRDTNRMEQNWRENSEQVERAITAEAEIAEFRNLQNKRCELEKKAYEARTSSHAAEREVEFAEEGWKTARLDGLGEIVERTALIKMV